MVAYVLGLVVTVGVMEHFKAAQPALLYLVPACLGATAATAWFRKELPELLAFDEEAKPAADVAAAAGADSKADEGKKDK